MSQQREEEAAAEAEFKREMMEKLSGIAGSLGGADRQSLRQQVRCFSPRI